MKTVSAIILTILCLLDLNIYGQNGIDEYELEFSRKNEFCLHVKCRLTTKRDSLQLAFGGGDSISVTGLKIKADNLLDYDYDISRQALTIRLSEAQKSLIEMEYDYANIRSAFIYGSHGAEGWELSIGEFYYPFIFGQKSLFSVSFKVPRNMTVLGGYPLKKVQGGYTYTTPVPVASNTIVFNLIQTNRYETEEFCAGDYCVKCIYKKGSEIPAHRKTELAELTKATIVYFSEIFEPYQNVENQIAEKPTYLFHDGNGYSNRNDVNYISASGKKFCTKPNIIPLVHEIGHRWLGEWTLFIEDGQPGAYFIKESLNEVMTLLFVKHHYGQDYFEQHYHEVLQSYEKIKGTKNDVPLIELVRNNNFAVVYDKGPVILYTIIEEWGEENWLRFIGNFYNRYKYDSNLTYDRFIATLAEESPEYASKLDRMVRGQ